MRVKRVARAKGVVNNLIKKGKMKNNPHGPPNPPKCRHGKIVNPIQSNCADCRNEDTKIKNLVHPLIDEYWKNKGRDDLYHIVRRAYYMGMRKEGLENV